MYNTINREEVRRSRRWYITPTTVLTRRFDALRHHQLANLRPFAQLLPGLETGHPVTVGQSPAYDFSVCDELKGVFLVSVSDCSECDSYAGDWPTVTGCPVSNPGNNCANGLKLANWWWRRASKRLVKTVFCDQRSILECLTVPQSKHAEVGTTVLHVLNFARMCVCSRVCETGKCQTNGKHTVSHNTRFS